MRSRPMGQQQGLHGREPGMCRVGRLWDDDPAENESGLVGSNHTRRTSADRGVFLWILMATTGSGVKAVPAVPRRSSE